MDVQGHAQRECANCGETESLLRCGRCRYEWYCSRQCQKAFWPFHRDRCKRNEFADAVEASQNDPKFAEWMRSHGKLAVLKDDEVERLERAGRAACGPFGRAEVLESMYGRIDPKPMPPSYNLEESKAMQEQREVDERQAGLSAQTKTWAALTIPEGLGLECAWYKWRQSLSHVEVYCLVPSGIVPSKVNAVLGSNHLLVTMGDAIVIQGDLHKTIEPVHSTWFIVDSVLHIYLLKRNRKGHYLPGTTNADTWWRSLLTRAGPLETIQTGHAPTRYYWLEQDAGDEPDQSTKHIGSSIGRPRILAA